MRALSGPYSGRLAGRRRLPVIPRAAVGARAAPFSHVIFYRAMHLPRLLLAALLCFTLGPAVAQDGGGDDSGIEEDSAPPEGSPDDGDDEETKKKNVGLAGGGEEDDGDADAPKVKADLQTRINEAIAKGVEALKK